MKKVVIITVCILGILSLASCKSSSRSCGLADNTELIKKLDNKIYKV